MTNSREGLFVRLGRLITMPEQVDKLEEKMEGVSKKVDDVNKVCSQFVTRKEMVDTIGSHGKIHNQKLDLAIKLLKGNNSLNQQAIDTAIHQAKQDAK